MGHLQQVGQIVELLLCDLTLIDDDGVLQVATLDEVCIEKRHNVAHEDKRTGRCNLCGEIANLVDSSKLAIDELRLERAHGGNRELVVGQNGDARTRLFVFYFYLLANDVPVLCCRLLFDAHFLNLLYVHDGRAVEDRELRAVDLNKAVVDTECIECCHTMFDGRHAHIALCQNCATLGINNFLGDGLDDGLSFKVDALDAITSILGCGVEGYGKVETCVQSLSRKGETALEGPLLHCFHL